MGQTDKNHNRIVSMCAVPPRAACGFFLIGAAVVVLLYLPMLFLGENALIIAHDQLDGEELVYILRAAHIGETTIPELFNGVSVTALTPASVGTLILHCVFPASAAFFINYILIAIVSYVGMYLCLDRMFHIRWLAMTVAVIFSILPFYSVYGLSVMGQPLFLFALIELYRGNRKWLSYAMIAFFAFCSSLILVGYADILILLAVTVFLWIRKKPEKMRFTAASAELILFYVLLNFRILYQMFWGDSFVSHKTEMVASSGSAISNFRNVLLDGKYHAASVHTVIFIFCLAMLFFLLCGGRRLKVSRKWFGMFVALFAACILIAAFYALWHSEPVADWRNQAGGLFVSFQVDRFYWLYPCLWYLLLGVAVFLVWKYIPVKQVGTVAAAVMLCVSFGYVYHDSTVKANVEAAVKAAGGGDTQTGSYTTWKSFFSEDLFADIKEYIGTDPSTYRVASIGLYPSIALYNGFYCLDGYSNNYDVNYKHEFRRIIAAELDKNESLRTYFDNWGNRCYLFVDQIPQSYQITKDDQTVLTDLNLDTGQLAAMGCGYLLSALPIDSPYMADSLEFCAVFEDEYSPYAVYLYRVSE